MASIAQFASTPKVDFATITAADGSATSISAPTYASVGHVFTAGNLGSRIDSILLTSVSATVATVAGQIRLFIVKGAPGVTISSITTSTTTATITTSANHGVTINDLITVQNCYPFELNVKGVAVVGVTATTIQYTITSIGNASATTIGSYATTRGSANLIYGILKEYPVTATTPGSATSIFCTTLSSQLNPEILPIILPPGYSLRASLSVAQTGISVTASGGDF